MSQPHAYFCFWQKAASLPNAHLSPTQLGSLSRHSNEGVALKHRQANMGIVDVLPFLIRRSLQATRLGSGKLDQGFVEHFTKDHRAFADAARDYHLNRWAWREQSENQVVKTGNRAFYGYSPLNCRSSWRFQLFCTRAAAAIVASSSRAARSFLKRSRISPQ